MFSFHRVSHLHIKYLKSKTIYIYNCTVYICRKFVLKVLWLEKSLGIALDQRVGKTTQPVTEYFFWPRKDAWDELKDRLNSYSWVSQSEAISLLNQTTLIINIF